MRKMIWGTRDIAVAVFGPEHAQARMRSVYTLIAHGKLPVFKLGRTPCAWSDQIETFLEAKTREAADNMAEKVSVGASPSEAAE
ncbi:MAG: hypothetical protein WCC90_19660 [Methylocella sp.]